MPPNERNIILLIIYWPLYIHYLYILYYLHLQRRRSHWSRIQKQPPGVFLRTSQISLESTCVGVSKKDSYAVVFQWNLRNSLERLLWRASINGFFCLQITSAYIDLYNSLQNTFFIFTYNFFFITQPKQ